MGSQSPWTNSTLPLTVSSLEAGCESSDSRHKGPERVTGAARETRTHPL